MQQTLRRFAYAAILAAGLVWIAESADHAHTSTSGLIPAPQQGFAAPEFTLQTPGLQTVSLSDFRGMPVLIDLWATWCPPCRAEMPTIEKLYQEDRAQGLVVLGVNATVQDDASAVPGFVSQFQLSFPILLDVQGEVANLYELRSLPTSFFVGRDGVIKDVVVGGPMPEALLRAKLQEILE